MSTEKLPLHIVSWSGGKDSTATIILAHELGLPVDLIIISLVWFDKKRKIYADKTNHIKWIFNTAIPLFESWGYSVKVVSSDRDYLHYFYKIRKQSKYPENNGKYYGFLMGGFCVLQQEKTRPIKEYLRPLKKQYEIFEYIGICADEPKRLEKMHKRKNQISLLEKENKTQQQAKAICNKYNLLSPLYNGNKKRGGCWFCPNQPISELAELKQEEPEKWKELEALSKVENTVARGFKYGVPFEEINRKVDEYIANPPPVQLTLFN